MDKKKSVKFYCEKAPLRGRRQGLVGPLTPYRHAQRSSPKASGIRVQHVAITRERRRQMSQPIELVDSVDPRNRRSSQVSNKWDVRQTKRRKKEDNTSSECIQIGYRQIYTVDSIIRLD